MPIERLIPGRQHPEPPSTRSTGLVITPLNRHQLPTYLQAEASECALACIAMIAAFHGSKTDLPSLRRRFGLSLRGASLNTLVQIADSIGLASRCVKVPLGAIGKLRTPAILHWDFNHFVVLARVSSTSVTVHDPARGRYQCSIAEVSDSFTGVAVELTPTDQLVDLPASRVPGFAALWRRSSGMGRALFQIVMLSVVLQLFVIASPLYLQIVVDEVLPNFNRDLLMTLALGFGLFAVINAVTEALRSYVLIHSGSLISFQFATDLFAHLTRLPLDYFEKRHVGDILSRFGSLGPIKDALIQGVASVMVDGLMLLVTLLLMLAYSPSITLIVLLALVLYTALRLGLYHRFRRLSEQAIIAKAREDSASIETLRAMLPLKIFCRETERRHKWQNLLADTINAEADLAKTQMWFALANALIFGLENTIVIYVAATEVFGSSFTVGMLFAFMNYKRQFVDKSLQVVEVAIELKMLGLHFDRLADIKTTPVENVSDAGNTARCCSGEIKLENICYRYAPDQANVIEGITLSIPAGQRVALTGPSGCGKTTLVKIVLGLLQPGSGEIRIDGIPLSRYGVRNYRQAVAAVMQEDQLFAGSVAGNIAFFDTALDMNHVMRCARQAAIYDDIMAMPMAFETLIGDMGSALSGGQKQRLLLARALYANPAILVMDEGTAHLDDATESAINRSLRQLDITTIVVAHRSGSLRAADRVVTLHNGCIIDDVLQEPVIETDCVEI